VVHRQGPDASVALLGAAPRWPGPQVLPGEPEQDCRAAWSSASVYTEHGGRLIPAVDS